MNFLERLILVNQEYLRVFMISALGQALGLFLLCTMLERRRGLGKIIAFMLVKLFFSLNIAFIMFGSVIPETEFSDMLRLVGTGCLNFAMLLVFSYSFNGSFIKIALGVTVSEILVSCIMLPSVMAANILAGREDMFTFYGELQTGDILIPVIEAILVTIVYRIASPLLKRYRKYRIPRERVWLWIWSVYFISIQFMSVSDLKTGSSLMILMYGVYLALDFLLLIILYLLYWRYQNAIDLESDYLNTQLKLLESHYMTVQQQTELAEKCQELLEDQMNLLRSRDYQQEHIRQYMDTLQEEYQQIKEGVYCSDILIDAVLSGQKKVAEEAGIKTEYQIQGYHRGNVKETDLARLLLLLFEYGISEKRTSISLKLQTSVNYLIVTWESTGGKIKMNQKLKNKLKAVEQYVKTLNGIVKDERKDGCIHLDILLPVMDAGVMNN